MSQVVQLITNNAVPQPSLAAAPTITIARLDTDVEVVSDAAMTSVVRGLWRYDFTQDPTLEYAFIIDADPLASGQVTADERYSYGSLSGTDIEHLDQLDAAVSSRNAVVPLDAATDQAEHDATQAAIAGLNDPSAADVSDAVWDEARAGHTTPGTYGEFTGDVAMRGTDGANTTVPLDAATDQAEHDATQAAIAGIPAAPSAADNADAVWDEARAGHVTPGTYGEFTGDAAMRGTDGANTVVPLDAATDQAEHDATQAAIAALTSLTPADVTAAVWGITEAALAAAGETGELLLFGNTLRSDIDFTGNDALGWQLVIYDRNDTEIARANLFDEAFARIPGATSVAAFITANKAIARVDII